ncbi:MAG: DUF5819 family protein [Thermoflexales bacterium]
MVNASTHRRIVIRSLLLLIGFGVLCIHFAFVVAYLAPLNPIKLQFHAVIQRYIEPYFVQSWQLFSPDPVRDTRVWTVACKLRNEDGTTRISEWVDISSPYWAARQRNRFTPEDRLDRAQSSAIQIIFGRDDLLKQLESKRDRSDESFKALLKELDEADRKHRENGIRLINRIASAHCDQLYGMGRTLEVRARLIRLEFPRYSERFLPDSAGKREFFVLDWAPHQSVAPIFGQEMRESGVAKLAVADPHIKEVSQ